MVNDIQNYSTVVMFIWSFKLCLSQVWSVIEAPIEARVASPSPPSKQVTAHLFAGRRAAFAAAQWVD